MSHKRVHIIGGPESGKSYIAGIIAEKYSIPVLDLGCTVNDCKNAADVLVMAKGKTAGYPMLLKVSAT